ncbi:MAG: MFS transporter, partial [bacterium]
MEKTMTKYNELVIDNLNRNFIANITDGVFFSFGMGFISMTTILPYFVSQLTNSKLVISMIVSIFMFGSTLPQLFAANYAETLKRKKKAIIIIGTFHRLPFLLLFIFTFIFTDTYSNLLLILFYLCWTIYSMATGTVIPFWFDMLTKVIPMKFRGKFFGYISFIGSILEVIGASIAGLIIKNYIFPLSFNIIFGLTTLALSISFIALFFIKEPEYPTAKRKSGISSYIKNLR